MKKIAEQNYTAANNQYQGNPVELDALVVAGFTLSNGEFFGLQSKNYSNTTLSSRGIAGGDDFAIFQTGAPEVRGANASRTEATWSWCGPSRNLFGFGLDSKSKSAGEIFSLEPTDLDGLEGIVNFNTLMGEYDLRADYENPVNSGNGQRVQCSSDGAGVIGNVYESTGSQSANQEDYREVNPVGTRAINVVFGHVFQTTPDVKSVSEDLDTKEGIQNNGK